MQANYFNKLCFQIRDKYDTICMSLKDILRHILSLYCISNMCNIAHIKTTKSNKKKLIFFILL